MRNLILLLVAVIFGTSASFANIADDRVAERNTYRYDNSFIFLEEGITFAVYPDGEFDFYIDNRVTGRRNNVTFNSGFDYSPFAQYDDYGAVIQVENIPIFYDFYGRVSQVGSVDINYHNGRVNRLGGMFVFYNNRGFYDYHTGFINVYNRHYVYRPFHSFFARPAIGFCFVRTTPYRRYYNPFRYTFYNPYRNNRRNTFAQIGRVHRYNEVRRERSTIYRNDKRVALRDNNVRNNRTVAQVDKNTVRTNRSANSRSTNFNNERTIRGNNTARSNNVVRSTDNGRTIKRTTAVTRTPQRSTVTKRTVVRTPKSGSVTKTTVNRPTQRTSRSANVDSRSTVQRSVSKAPARSSNVSTRSSSSSRSVAKTPTRSRNTTARSTTSTNSRSNRSATTSRSTRARQ